MKRRLTNRKGLLNCISIATLLIGLGCAGLIYLRADIAPENPLLNEFEYSKRYQHDLELYGGKANVIANEITNWFESLWHGKRLAYTVACIAVLLSCVPFFAARLQAADGKTAAKEKGEE